MENLIVHILKKFESDISRDFETCKKNSFFSFDDF